MNRRIILLLILLRTAAALYAQPALLELTLQEAICHAQQQSPDAQSAQHRFRSEYWNYKYYKANYLPSLTLTSNPYLNRTINKVTMSDGTVQFVEQNMLSTDLALTFTQNIPLTGGSIFLETNLQRMDMLSDHTSSWQSLPLNVGYSQSLFGYNSLKWSRRIEPVRYQEARKSYVETLELIAAQATLLFFDLATAQSNLETAEFNYAGADTLYQYAQGRYSIGTITENEMLQLELNKLAEETNCINARIELDNGMQTLRSYLGIQQDLELKVKVEDAVPDFSIELNEALQLANANSPDMLNMQRRKLESESAVVQARANAGLKADIYVRLGLTDQQYITLGISLPILDWGRGKGQVKVARSNRDLVYTQVDQEKSDFDLNVRKLVKQFNLQAQRVKIAARTDETARRRYDVARRLYILGKSTILDLNASISEKDSARRSYINTLYNYWSLFYTLRSLTLYDFERQEEIRVEMEE